MVKIQQFLFNLLIIHHNQAMLFHLNHLSHQFLNISFQSKNLNVSLDIKIKNVFHF